MKVEKEYFSQIRGAVYIPCRAYNAYQQWRDYKPEITMRDMGYAEQLHINAIRVWLSFEFWQEQPEVFMERFENLLQIASEKGIRVMPSLFECCGREPSRENMEDTDQMEATAVRSPGTEITNDPSRWTEIWGYVDQVLDKYKNDTRVLAIEVTNEPKSVEDHRFAIAVAQRVKGAGGTVPVTMGAQELLDNLLYVDLLDIFQTHENFPLSAEKLVVTLGRLRMVQTILEKPFWITEWQRLRSGSASGFSSTIVDKTQVRPNHEPLAQLLRENGFCGFVWSLMLKPAYLKQARRSGTFSGIFHEDGSVYSLADARAVSGDYNLQLKENHTLPECFDKVAKISE